MTDTRKAEGRRGEVRAAYAAMAKKGTCGQQNGGSLRVGYSEADLRDAPEGSDLGLGCGNPGAIAQLRPGETVLDLGSGAGFDCFLAARRVGCGGRVIGVDMTPEMIARARGHAADIDCANVDFRLGEIECLPVPSGFIDVVLSNCAISLSPDKPRVFAEAFRVLKPGGRLAISDVVKLEPGPVSLQIVEGDVGCVDGAMSAGDLARLLESMGFGRVVVDIQLESRTVIAECLPGAEDYIASASIEAYKPRLKEHVT